VSKKNHAPAPVPPGNRPQAGTGYRPEDHTADPDNAPGTGFNEQDGQRRLGDYEGAGESSIVQPGGRAGSDRSSG
jgi:hypothetical protein